MKTNTTTRKEVLVFLTLTLLFSSLFYYLIISAGSIEARGGFYILFLTWSPGFAALLTRLYFHRNIRGIGAVLPGPRYLGTAYLLPVLYALPVYALVWATGIGKIYLAALPSGWEWLFLLTAGVLISCLGAMGEEIGWRGLLLPHLVKLTGFTRGTLITAAIWVLWYSPIILMADYDSRGLPLWYAWLCFTLMLIGVSFVYSWLRLKSGSLYPAVLLHATHNLFIQGLFDPLTIDTGTTKYIIGEFGAGLAVTGMITGVIFWWLYTREAHKPARGEQLAADWV
jgi:uncharacterized protein